MCEFCHQHGEGKKRYLNAGNYAGDLLSDLRRRRMITRFFENPDHLAKGERTLTALDVMPDFLWKGLRAKITARQQVKHFGQVTAPPSPPRPPSGFEPKPVSPNAA